MKIKWADDVVKEFKRRTEKEPVSRTPEERQESVKPKAYEEKHRKDLTRPPKVTPEVEFELEKDPTGGEFARLVNLLRGTIDEVQSIRDTKAAETARYQKTLKDLKDQEASLLGKLSRKARSVFGNLMGKITGLKNATRENDSVLIQVENNLLYVLNTSERSTTTGLSSTEIVNILWDLLEEKGTKALLAEARKRLEAAGESSAEVATNAESILYLAEVPRSERKPPKKSAVGDVVELIMLTITEISDALFSVDKSTDSLREVNRNAEQAGRELDSLSKQAVRAKVITMARYLMQM